MPDYNTSVVRMKIWIWLTRKERGVMRVFIVDGQAEVRRGLRMRLGIEPDMVIVGETGDIEHALVLAETLDPDVIVVDIGMHGADGLSLIERLRAAAPTAAVVVHTLRSNEATRTRALRAGAAAFLEKGGGAADLVEALRRLASRPPAVPDRDPSATRRLSDG
jgi:DNA-binding NarL/FixJ family response regulator